MVPEGLQRPRKRAPGNQQAILVPRVAISKLNQVDLASTRAYLYICALNDGRLIGGPHRLARWAKLTTFKSVAALESLLEVGLITQVPAPRAQTHPFDYVVTDWLDPATYEPVEGPCPTLPRGKS